jgi:hypothetical protein
MSLWTLRENSVARQCARPNSRLNDWEDPVLDSNVTDNNMELKGEAEEKKRHRMAKVHNFLEMWQGSQT